MSTTSCMWEVTTCANSTPPNELLDSLDHEMAGCLVLDARMLVAFQSTN